MDERICLGSRIETAFKMPNNCTSFGYLGLFADVGAFCLGFFGLFFSLQLLFLSLCEDYQNNKFLKD